MSSLWTPGGEHPVEREPEPATPGQGEPADVGEPGDDLTPEQQARLEQELADMQQQLANTPAEVIIANHAIGLFQLAALHLGRQPPDLVEGRLAIDAMAGILERLAGRLGEQEQGLRDGLAQLQLAYVQLAQQAGAPAPDGPPAGEGTEG